MDRKQSTTIHPFYQELYDLIGHKATIILAKRFNGQCLYFPRLRGDLPWGPALPQGEQGPSSTSAVEEVASHSILYSSLMSSFYFQTWFESIKKIFKKQYLPGGLFRRRKRQKRRGVDNFDILSLPVTLGAGSFHIGKQLKEEISRGFRLCRLSRYEVAAKMSEMLGYEITKGMLDAYTAESKENHRFPAEWLAPFCLITGYYEPIKIINRLARLPLPDTGKLLNVEIMRIKKEMAGMEEELRKYEGLKQLIEKGGDR